MARVLVVEDDESISEVLAYHLKKAGHQPIIAKTGLEGLRRFEKEPADLVLLDLMLPEMDGWKLCERLRARSQGVPIIVCSARSSEFDKVHSLSLGADDYLTKPFGMAEMIARVAANLRRGQYERDQAGKLELVQHGDLVIDPRRYQAYYSDRSLELTPREFNLLSLLARSEGLPLTRDEIYRQVWGYEMMHGDRSIDVFVRKLRKKMAIACPHETFIQTHHGVGYRFERKATEVNLTQPSLSQA